MKNKLLLPALLMTSLLSAQKLEVKASYGAPSIYGISENLTEAMTNIFTLSDVIEYESSGVLAVELLYTANNPKLQYGLAYHHESIKDSDYNFSGSFNSLLAEVNYNWNNPENKFKFYSGAGVGALFYSREIKNGIQEDSTQFAFNVTPIGIRYGGKLGVFLEANIGTKGLAQGGLSYKF